MARPLRIAFPGAIYHVTCRMVGRWADDRNRLFTDDADRWRFMDQLAERVDAFRIRLYQYCLMTNHAHLVFETPISNVTPFMHSLTTAYSVYFNRRHDRHGHLLDGRFGGKLVEENEYIQALSRYVHLNPVATEDWKDRPLAERRKALRAYRWSSYPEYIGARKPSEFVSHDLLLGTFPGRGATRMRRYREFVELGLAKTDEDFEACMKRSAYAIGSAGFVDWVRDEWVDRFKGNKQMEDVARRRPVGRLKADEVLRALADLCGEDPGAFRERRRHSPLRSLAAGLLAKYAGMSQRDIARFLDVGTGAAVSIQLRNLPEWLKADAKLNRLYERAERVMDKQIKEAAKSS